MLFEKVFFLFKDTKPITLEKDHWPNESERIGQEETPERLHWPNEKEREKRVG